ncbi:MAG: type II toxin-antitoxin system VapC family toxin [Gemmataceae bacterium]
MIGIVDTHTFLWLADTPEKVSADAAAFLRDPANEPTLSLASVWELVIKTGTGKLKLKAPVEAMAARWVRSGGRLLPITLEHVLAVQHLPSIHRDPFDRLLIAQAREERAALVSDDATVKQYPVPVIW